MKPRDNPRPKSDEPRGLAALRRAIDRVDDRIADLLVERAQLARAIGAAKAEAGLPAVDPARERAILARLATKRGPVPAAALRRVFRVVIDETRRLSGRPATGATSGRSRPSRSDP